MNKVLKIPFTIERYEDEVECRAAQIHACHIILKRSCLFDRKVVHKGRITTHLIGKIRRLLLNRGTQWSHELTIESQVQCKECFEKEKRMSDKRLIEVRVSKVTTIEWKQERKCEVN